MRVRPHSTGRNLTGALALGLALALLAAVPAEAQYFRFGKNKVQYRTLDWHHLPSDRVDVYYYEPGGGALAAFTARAAEDALEQVEELLGHRMGPRLVVLVYQGHNDFAVTNAAELPAYAEGIGGVTEGFKNRVALPFTGDRREFRRVLHHEVVHAVANDLFYGGTIQRVIRSGTRLRLPLWFSEGLAEYAALGWDTASDVYLREALVHDRLPPISGLRGFLAYRGGQGVFDYVAAEYGREKVAEIVQRTREEGSVGAAVEGALGLSLGALSERWHAALRAVHFPEVAAREALEAVARPLVPGEEGGRFSTAAAISPQGDRVAYLTTRDALFDVVVASTVGEPRPRRLIEGQRSPAFESFHVLSPGLSWDPSGTRLAVAVKAGASDAIALVDASTGRARHYRVPELDAILSVRWSPDGARIAFSAVRGPQSDLYLLDLASEAVTNLTADAFSDLEPAWAPDGQSLVFHSDRGDHLDLGRADAASFDLHAHDYAAFSLYRLRLDDPHRLERLTHDADWDETGAAFGDDPDRLLYISDRNGVPNLYELDLAAGASRPLTDLLTGVQQVSLSADGQRAALVALREGVPSIYLLLDPFERRLAEDPAPTVWAQRVLGARAPRPAPALAVAHPTTAEDNPFLREAAHPAPFLADPMRRRRVPEAERLLARDPLAEAPLAMGGGGTAPGGGERPGGGGGYHEEGGGATGGGGEPRRYRLRFSPDLVYGNLGYDAVFGVQSLTQVAFSDLLGNHRLTAATNLVVDLRNSDYLLAYEYLPRRTDYALTGFHLARQLTDFDRRTVYRYRNYGLVATASYPLSKFRRVEAEASLQGVELADLIDPTLRSRGRVFLHPALTYTADVTAPGFLGPSGGHRLAVRLSGSPGPSVSFVSLLADARQYVGGRDLAVALRASGGASIGRDPQRYYAAGVQNWINAAFDGTPIRDENDFVFGTPILPLRGHAFDAASGDRFVLLNAEARVPLVAALLPGPLPVIPLYRLQGVAFVDAAAVPQGRFTLWRDASEEEGGGRVLDDVLVGGGLGLRTLFLGYPLRLDWAWPFDGHRFGEGRFYFSVGLDF